MSWRTVVISKRCKLDLNMNYLVVRGEDTKRILLDEIAILIIENNAISITGCLLSALMEKKIKFILCDEKRNPQGEMLAYHGCHNDVLKIKRQLAWTKESEEQVWTSIVKEKISNQARVLKQIGKMEEADKLENYTKELVKGDITNREGHAAKVYFNALFGKTFTRSDESLPVNAALNYGYAILLSAFSREVSANGYLNQLGIFHDNQFNHYNLSCDLMEPFRPLVDKEVKKQGFEKFDKEEKHILVDILNKPLSINQTKQTVLNAIKIYVRSVFDALEEENSYLIKSIEV